jgi:hypothetical protein
MEKHIGVLGLAQYLHNLKSRIERFPLFIGNFDDFFDVVFEAYIAE